MPWMPSRALGSSPCGLSRSGATQLSRSSTPEGDHGTGLGLAMVFGIIKRHQGALEIESEIGQGTTFRIRLPAVTSLAPPAIAA
ncbi:MAG: hypothetical protein DMG40_27175 [Acidobacteria bacterium]|nr:MAG: hypothetical protein DMG40_27175 [Acidobacteriota bacterium]